MRALHFGAGNIGRALIGRILVHADCVLVFADVNNNIIDALNKHHGYRVKIVAADSSNSIYVNNVSAVLSNSDDAIKQFVNANLVTTAVGPVVLNKLVATFRRGLLERMAVGITQPLNIIACENSVRASSQLREMILTDLSSVESNWITDHVGFVDSVIDGIVPPTLDKSENPLDVSIEEYGAWIVDSKQFIGDIPLINGMLPVDNLMAYLERKLFTLNTGHAILAYIGHLKGYNTILQAVNDKEIYQQVKAAMHESGAVLIRRYGFKPEQHAAYIETVLTRFANPALSDNIDRVGREPIRKLGNNDRLIRPLLGTIEYNLPNEYLIKGIVAALCYRNDSDPEAVEIERMIADSGPENVLKNISFLDVEIIQKILQEIENIN